MVPSDRPIRPETFEGRLERFLLVAFARGVDVEGTWELATGDPVIAPLSVTVARADVGPTLTQATGDDPTFADALEHFLLTEFADGVDIEGSWAVRFARQPIPAWDVDVAFCERSDQPNGTDG